LKEREREILIPQVGFIPRGLPHILNNVFHLEQRTRCPSICGRVVHSERKEFYDRLEIKE
jgi:hypothetical protein